MYAPPRKFDGPMQMPLPPMTSMPSLIVCRARSVMWYLAIADTTAGFSPRSIARGGQHARRVHHVEVAAHARERFLDALELADRAS